MNAVPLYIAPFLVRAHLEDERVDAWRVALSVLPVLLTLPSIYLPRWITDERREHVARHAIYALSFCVAAATAVRWDRVAWERDRALIAYLIVGGTTLWWFCASHALENARFAPLRTHKGDVVVLPLTLVAIGTFAYDVPDEVFQFSRSVLYFTPVIVSWATLTFIAYHDFAVRTTTTFSEPTFDFWALSALLVAALHLVLLEARATPLAFVLFAPSLALLAQVTPDRIPTIRPRWHVGTWILAASGGAVVATLLQLSVAVVAYAAVAATIVRVVAGRAWIGPATVYASFGASVVLQIDDVWVVLLLALGLAVTFCVIAAVAPAVCEWTPPHADPPRDKHATPQTQGGPYTISQLMLRFDVVKLPASCVSTYDAFTLERFFDRVDPHCPVAFRGVWWMEGNTFPMDLVCVHRASWSADGKRAFLWNRRDITRRASLAGVLMHMISCASFTHIQVFEEDERWIRTDGWFGPRWLAHTYWLCKIHDDEMLRLVYDAEGRVVWQYRMRRIARDAHTRTRAYDEFLRHCRGQGYLLVT